MNAISVLIVDDNTDYRHVLAERLTIRGCQVRSVGNAAEALAAVEESSFDVVVLDLVMPGADGLDTLKALKHVNPDLPVIMVTGYGGGRDRAKAEALGVLDFLLKPVELPILLARIEEAVEERRRSGSGN